jgi:hypothetical protein
MKYLVEIKADHPLDHGAGAQERIVHRLEQVMDEEGFDNIDTVINNQGGEITEGVIHRMSMGKLALGPNGILLTSTQLDPAEMRLGAPVGQKAVAIYCGDMVRSDGRHVQLGQVQFCVDSRRGSSLEEATGCIRFLLRDPRRAGPEDKHLVCVFTLAVDGPWLNMMPHMPGTPGMPT